ncbi:hypothetical protein E2C01_018111 [Portunus trituberculatus]|uniref:Uncharacterized protein n=1 Tax=Portunus trituberculatus TaxID=210409 RepID=A0A5B7DVJ7_PORTR|nr:hypothetical protein [Portunus trituberculatus]
MTNSPSTCPSSWAPPHTCTAAWLASPNSL